MKIKKIILGIIIPLISQNICGQSSIYGYLKDTKQQPLPFANVVLYSLPDSSFVSGEIADKNGFFEINTSIIDSIFIKVSCIGYSDYIVPLCLEKNKINVGVIMLDEYTTILDEIVVKVARPRVYNKGGNIITEISSSDLSKIGSAKDVLKYIPGVISSENKIEVFGKGSPVIYIDNKKIQNIKELDLISSDNIQKVELITNPGAEYDAETRSVLKITTNKNKNNGLSLILNSDVSHSLSTSFNDDVFINLNYNKFNAYGSYRYNKLKGAVLYNIDQVTNQEFLFNEISSSKYFYDDNDQSYSIGFSYDFNKKYSIGSQFNSYHLKSNIYSSPTDDWLLMYKDNDLITSNINSMDDDGKEQFYNPNFYFEAKPTDNIKIQIDGDYVFNKAISYQKVIEQSLLSTDYLETNIFSLTKNEVYALKGGIKHILNKAHELNYGVEYSHISVKGKSENVEGILQNNEYINQEDKYAGYFLYKYNNSTINAHIGIRYENISSNNKETSKEELNRNYSDFLPSIAISFPIRDVTISTSFTNKISRPSFSELNSKISYNSIYHQETGNPYLNSSHIYDSECVIGYKFINLRVNYQYIKDYIYTTVAPSSISEASSVWYSTNAPKFSKIGAILVMTPSIGLWNPTLTIGVYKQKFNIEFSGNNLNYTKPYALLSLANEFKLPYNYIVRADIDWNTKGNIGIYEYSGFGNFDISLQKSFLSDQLNLRISGSDIFNWKKTTDVKRINYIYSHRTTNSYARSINISVAWYFNKIVNYYKGGNAAAQEINRI